MNEEELIQRARQGDATARDCLARNHRAIVMRVIQRYVRGPDAEDVAQRAIMRALDRLDSFRGEASFRSWISRIASNTALNHLRDTRREIPSEFDEADLVTNSLGTSRLVAQEAKLRLRAAIEKLPDKQRHCVQLRLFQDLSFAEVASELNISEDSAKVNFHHAMKRLRDVLENDASVR